MSAKMTGWAFEQRGLKPTEKIVLLALADWANDDGDCWPGQLTIAAKTDLSESTVRRCLHRLAELGLITWEERRRPDGYRSSNLYRLLTSPVNLTADISPVKTDDLTGQTDRSHRSTVTAQEPLDRTVSEPSVTPLKSPALFEADPLPTFDEFWQVWPRKEAKPVALRAWSKAVKRADADLIYRAAVAYRDNPWVPDREFIPMPATWLNQDRWNDPLPGPKSTGKERPNDRAARIIGMATSMGPQRPEQKQVGR